MSRMHFGLELLNLFIFLTAIYWRPKKVVGRCGFGLVLLKAVRCCTWGRGGTLLMVRKLKFGGTRGSLLDRSSMHVNSPRPPDCSVNLVSDLVDSTKNAWKLNFVTTLFGD